MTFKKVKFIIKDLKMLIIVSLGLVTSFNFLILLWKFNNKRYLDLSLDISSIIVLNLFFGKTLTGMLVAMVASAVMSLYLLINKPSIKKSKSK